MLLRLSKHGSAHPTIGECAPAKNRGNPWSPEGRNPTGREVSTTTNNPSPRFALFAAMSLVLVTAARGPMAAASPLADGATPGEITVIATEFNYAPARVWVVAGRPITLVLDNSRAETEHGIVIPAFEFRLEAQAGETARATAVFDKPGEYEFTCDFPGHREAGMSGKLIVGGR